MKGFDTFLSYVELHYPAARTLEEWVYTSQLNQRDELRFGIEHYRRSEFCKGSLVWQLNDCWPVQSWAVVDFGLDYKAAAYELRRLYASALVSLIIDEGRARVWAISDNHDQPREADASLEVFDLRDGSCLQQWRQPVKVGVDGRKLAIERDVSSYPAGTTILRARFAGSETFRLLGEPKDCQLEAPTLSARHVEGGIEIDADSPVVDLLLFDPTGRTKLLDNVITLPQGGRVKLRCRGATPRHLVGRSLAGPVELTLA
jgi:beta-mannosidase